MPTRLALVLALAVAAPAGAEPLTHRLSLAAGGEATFAPELGGHGIVIASYELGGLPHGARLFVDLNTDTLRAGVDHIRFAHDHLEAGALVFAEALIAGLLTDYIRDGVADPARGFWASYAGAGGYLKYGAGPHFLELGVAARRWFFSRQGGTSAALILPPEAFVGELRVHYTYWAIAPDPSLWERQRLFPRVRGLAFGVEGGLDARSQAYAWGARDAQAFATPDLRNDPGRVIPSLRAWLRAGRQVHPRLRLELAQELDWMWNEDDLVRVRVGGMTPYAVPLAGAPWPAWLAGRLIAAEASAHVRVWRELEAGVLADGAVIDDGTRTSGAHPTALFGAGAFLDARWRAWQIDVRAGWSPTVVPRSLAAFCGFVDLGWSWQR